MPFKQLTVFICYSRSDATLCAELNRHLQSLVVDGTINVWYDQTIKPGDEWKDELESAMSRAHVALS